MVKKSQVKRNLFAGVSLAAFGAFISQGAMASTQTLAEAAGTVVINASNAVKYTGTGVDEIGTVADGVALGDTGVIVDPTTADGVGTLTFLGSSASLGTIGDSTHKLGVLNVGANGSTVSIDDDIFAVATKVTGTGTFNIMTNLTGTSINFNTGATTGKVLLDDAGTITANITASTASQGVVEFAGAGDVTGSIGATGGGNEIKLVTINAGAVTVSGNVAATTINFVGASSTGSLEMSNGSTLEGAITTDTEGAGTLIFTGAGGSSHTVTGDIGVASTGDLLLLTIGDTGTTTVTTSGDISALTINFATASTLSVANGKTVTGDITNTTDGQGTLTFVGTGAATSTVTGNIGDSDHNLALVTIGSGAAHELDVSGDIYATTINFATDSTLLVANGVNVAGTVTNTTGGDGTVTFDGTGGSATTVTGYLGVTGGKHDLALVTIGSGAAQTVNIAGGASSGITADTVNFATDSELVMSDGSLLEGTVVTNTTNGEGTVTFSGDATLATSLGATSHALKLISIGGDVDGSGGSSNNVYANAVNFTADNTFTVSDGATYDVDATTTTGGGTLAFDGAATVIGNIGTSGGSLTQLTVASGNGADTVDVDGDIYADTVTFGTNATATLTLEDGSDITGDIVASADNKGILDLEGSNTISGLIGTTGARLQKIVVNSASASDVVLFTDDVYAYQFDASGATSGATIQIAEGKTLTINSGGSFSDGNLNYKFGINRQPDSTDSVSKISVGAAAVSFAGSTFEVELNAASAALTTSDTFTVVTDNTSTPVLPGSVSDNSWLWDFDASVSSHNIILTPVVANALNTVSTVRNIQNIGDAVFAVANSGDAELDTVIGTIEAYDTAGEVEHALTSLDISTSTSGETTQTVQGAVDMAGGTIESHMDVAMNNEADEGVATGSMMLNHGMWGEAFGSKMDQSTRQNIAGYQADVVGGVMGADVMLSGQTRLGAAFAYGNIDATGLNNSARINSYQGSVYGSHDMGKLYFEGVGTVAYNAYDTRRTLFDTSVASGSFKGELYSGKLTAGYKMAAGNLHVTPFVSGQYSLVTQDDYNETGSSANLHVKNEDVNIFKSGLGTKFEYVMKSGGITYVPRVSGAWYYDFIGDEASTTSNFTSAPGTTWASRSATIAQSEFKVGAGLDILAQDNMTVSLDYNWNTKQDFDAHSGSVKARFDF